MTRVAAVLVTHDAQDWIESTLASIERQSRRPDVVLVVDDGSTDGTLSILAAHGIDVVTSRATTTDAVTRIAANFVQGVRACAGCDLVVLGDHDDVWHESRVAHQVQRFATDALMVASDGLLVDASGSRLGARIRDAFPVPERWGTLDPAQRMRYALRHSIATGGASAIRPDGYPDLFVPRGWLHDRWWSLVATARDAMVVDTEPVIDYRVSQGQQVGLDAAAQGRGPIGRLAALAGQLGRSWGKQQDLRRILRPQAVSDEVARAIRLRNVL